MQHEPNYTDHLTEHLGNRQRPSGIPEHLLDQVDAAALDGARAVDAVASIGRESGAQVKRSAASPDVFNRFGERYGDPLTELQERIHLAAQPIQPRYVYGAAPDRVLCRECLPAFLLDVDDTIQTYDASTDCDACGFEAGANDLHSGILTNGMVTYIVGICSACLGSGS